MSPKIISLLVLIGFWLFVLLISGLLAFSFAKKHQNFKKTFYPFRDELNKLKSIDCDLETIKIKYPLPKDELGYGWEENCNVYLEKTKSKTNKMLDKYYSDEIDEDEMYFLPKFKFTLNEKKYKKPVYVGDMFLTNNRLLIEDEKIFMQWPLEAIVNIWASCIKINSYNINCFVLKTKKETYQITCQNPKFIYNLMKLIKGE